MLRYFRAALALVFAVVTPPTLGATFYVATDGSDMSPGTLSEPWGTLNKAAAEAGAGDTVFVRGGEYLVPNQVRFWNTGPITFKNYADERPVFSYTGSEQYGFSVGQGADDITIEGLTFKRDTRSLTSQIGYIIGIAGNRTILRRVTAGFEPSNFKQPLNMGKDVIKGTTPNGAFGNYVTIEDSEVYGSHEQGIDCVSCTGWVIRNNYLHDNGSHVVLKDSRNNLIEGNLASNSEFAALELGGSCGFNSQMFMPLPDNPICGDKNSILRNNVIYNNMIATPTANGIALYGAEGAQVYHNSIYGGGVWLKSSWYQIDGGPQTYVTNLNNRLSNNIAVCTDQNTSAIVVIEAGNAAGLDLQNNVYWKEGGCDSAYEFNAEGTWMHYDAFAAMPYDAASLFADPQFKNTASQDLHLSPSSPAIDAGVVVADRTYDHEGNSIVGTPDIGAFEFQSADLSLTLTDAPDPAVVNNNITYTASIGNSGLSPASAVTLVTTLGSGASLVSATPSQGSCTGTGLITCNLGNLANAGTATVTVVARATTAAAVTTTASVSASEYDPNTADNSATATTAIAPGNLGTCNGKPVTLKGNSGNNNLTGTAGNDVISGLGGADTINSLEGDDTICGGNGADKLYGGSGNDTLLGGGGNDTLDGGDGTDTCNGENGLLDNATNCETVSGVP